MSTSDGSNSPDLKKSLIVVGSEQKSTGTEDGSSATPSDNTARGIFSKVVLKTESQADYDSLVTGLRDACQPKGTLEEILVQKLAAILWRYRRLITAESGEIGENLSSLGRTVMRLKERDRLESEALRRQESEQGVIGMVYDDPGLLSDCLRELQNLWDRVKAKGESSLSAAEDKAVLTKLYGRPTIPSGNIAKEIQRLTEIQNALNECQPERTELEQLRRNLPDADRMERLLRYEASLERAFDRTLAQLERLQGMRVGQPVTRPLKFGIPA